VKKRSHNLPLEKKKNSPSSSRKKLESTKGGENKKKRGSKGKLVYKKQRFCVPKGKVIYHGGSNSRGNEGNWKKSLRGRRCEKKGCEKR